MKKIVLITGANSGIGLASVKRLLKDDYFIFAHYHTTNNNLKKIKSNSLYIIPGDFNESKNVKKVFNTCMEIKNRIDILINNAGTFSTASSIEDISEDSFNKVMDVNLKAPFILSQLVLHEMKKNKWGKIINISSIGVKYGGNPGSAVYTISKAAMEKMTICFAKEGAPFNILVNAIRVGVVDTKFHDLNPSKNMEKRAKLIPLKRCAKPEEIAETIAFIVSDKSSFTTGSIITVAGGE